MVLNIVIVDANFILLPFQFKIDYLDDIRSKLSGPIKFIVFQQVIDELQAKSERLPKSAKFQNQLDSGLNYLELNKERFHIIQSEERKEKSQTTDDFLVKACLKFKEGDNRVYLATNDSELRKLVEKEGINTIFLRQRKFLAFNHV